MAPSTLTSLPMELICMVASHLSTSEYGSLRLTCKHVESQLFADFTKEFFTKRQFMLTHFSLKTLVDISKHPTFKKRLTHVILGMELFAAQPGDSTQREKLDRYRDGYNDQVFLLNTGMDRELLTEAFKNLENLQAVGLRDYSAAGRKRDGTGWHSYGLTTIRTETGFYLDTRCRTDNGASFYPRYLQILLYALGKANSSPRAIEAIFRTVHSYNMGPDLHIPDFVEPIIQPVLQQLQSLDLKVNLREDVGQNTYHQTYQPHACYGLNLRKFLGRLSNLTHLRLNFRPYQAAETDSFLQWFSRMPDQNTTDTGAATTTATVSYLPPPILLPHLRKLDLGSLDVEWHALCAVVEKYASSLEGLSLWRVQLVPLGGNLTGPRPMHWRFFFWSLAQIPRLQLKELMVGMVKQCVAEPNRSLASIHVGFKPPALQPTDYPNSMRNDDDDNDKEVPTEEEWSKCDPRVEYKNINSLQGVLEELASRLVVNWPKERPSVPIHVDSNSDEDEDEDGSQDDEEGDEDFDVDEDSEIDVAAMLMV
ncbi:hypothetical protein M011DRAFT_471262 [Sporormia fimetaria CBS 119925]|uniref:F-box domain-containing protein n=1 Tax=Sporormia fimetaria CBS 119925 TaxID=1340428 RepID=A0A6A6V0G4_9PLEO|nr:hypothetical protein M011DRAFT_471262 [Sporormia fimetaria CBS 119925]